MYAEVGVPQDRLLFKVPATWEVRWNGFHIKLSPGLSGTTSVSNFCLIATAGTPAVVPLVIFGRLSAYSFPISLPMPYFYAPLALL